MNRLTFAFVALILSGCGTDRPCTAVALCSASVLAVDTTGETVSVALDYSLDGGAREACDDNGTSYCCGYERAGEIVVYEVGAADALGSVTVTKGECHVSSEELTAIIPNSAPAPVITPGSRLEVIASHQECETDDDCAVVIVGCGMCDGDCAGVSPEHVPGYEEALTCEGFDGPECDFDCRPEFGLTRLRCIENTCGIVTDFDG
ncbi:MAG: hypothetical protein ACJAYU_004638 [Bradymonadia bacterium]|jgi:hypothetical protein